MTHPRGPSPAARTVTPGLEQTLRVQSASTARPGNFRPPKGLTRARLACLAPSARRRAARAATRQLGGYCESAGQDPALMAGARPAGTMGNATGLTSLPVPPCPRVICSRAVAASGRNRGRARAARTTRGTTARAQPRASFAPGHFQREPEQSELLVFFCEAGKFGPMRLSRSEAACRVPTGATRAASARSRSRRALPFGGRMATNGSGECATGHFCFEARGPRRRGHRGQPWHREGSDNEANCIVCEGRHVLRLARSPNAGGTAQPNTSQGACAASAAGTVAAHSNATEPRLPGGSQ